MRHRCHGLSTLALLGALAGCGQGANPQEAVAATGATAPPKAQTEHALRPQETSLSLINAKLRTPSEGRPTAAYLTIENGGNTPERLTMLTSPDFGRVELHDHVKDGDMVKMVKLDGLDLAPGSATALEPGGLHLMLFDPVRPLKNGDSVKIVLNFSNAGPIETNFVVLNEIPRKGTAMTGHEGH